MEFGSQNTVKLALTVAVNADHALHVQTVSKTETKQVLTAEVLTVDHVLLFVQMES
jgi:hypothetical protein